MTENNKPSPSLEQYAQKYIAVDDQLKLLQEKSKPLREWKVKLTNQIVKMMGEKKDRGTKENEDILEIPNNGGELRIYEKREYGSLTFTYIEKCLKELIPDESQVDFVMDYLRDHREVKYSYDLRRYQ